MFENLVKEYAEKGYRFAFRLSGNAEEAKDLVQEAFSRVLSKWNRYDASRPFDHYFLTILKNIYYDYSSRKSAHNLSLDATINDEKGLETFADRVSDGEEPLLEKLMRRETEETIEHCLGQIAKDHRAVLTLCDLEGLSYEKISQVLGCPIGTVKSRIKRARRALKIKLLAQLEEVPL